jgi:ligand-binding sensor domain-containing protein
MRILVPHIIMLSVFLCTLTTYAQQPAYTYYSIRDGLPSNDTYNCVEDKKGFLWIATENGVSRFNGKSYKNYTTTQGLPDNDILTVKMDNEGVIWVMPFQRTPAYYDETTDRFINSKTDKELSKIEFGMVNNCIPLATGGMGFWSSKKQVYIYKNKKVLTLNFGNNGIAYTTYQILSKKENEYIVVSGDSIRTFVKDKKTGAKIFNTTTFLATSANNQFYFEDKNILKKISILPDGSFAQVKEIELPFVIKGMNFTGKQIAISSINGNIYLADTATLAFNTQGFSFNALIRYVYEDNAGNTWICTKTNGLIRYQQKGISTISDEAFQKSFSSINYWNNQLVAGNNEGKLLLYKSPYDYKTVPLYEGKNFTGWIRQISNTQNDLLVATEGGLFSVNKNLQKIELFSVAKNIANKSIYVLNDSIIITGNSGGVKRVNINKLSYADSVRIRVTKLSAIEDGKVYVGSNTGLYKWENYKTLINLGEKNDVLSNRVSALAYNKYDNIMWVGLAIDTLVALQNDRPIAKIPLNVKLPGNECRVLYSTKKGELWIGTNQVLGRINYTIENDNLKYEINVFTTADGITGKQVNDIIEHNDTIYVATNNGVSILPAKLSFAVQEIPLFITNVKVNNANVDLQSVYDLSSNTNSISISFSSSDLGNTAERMYEYKINNGIWSTLLEENISLQQLSAGDYKIKIRALKRDGNPSEKEAAVMFKISAVFWKTIWFWVLSIIAITLLAFYFLQKRNKYKREQAIQTLLTEKKLSELELRALKAQINPHFVFNCLNSIKFLNHQKRFEETDIYLDKFSYLLRKTLDFSGLQRIPLEEELAYSKNYLELEKLRLGDKLTYEIITDENIDTTTTLVPPMLLQPYLENAIKHGIRHLQGEVGKVLIDTKRQGDIILCSISDNGVGIEKAATFNRLNNPGHTSQGTTLQQRRADLYNVAVQTTQGKNGIGTTVILTLHNEE